MGNNGLHAKSQGYIIQLLSAFAPLRANKIHHAFLSGYKIVPGILNNSKMLFPLGANSKPYNEIKNRI
jgi:hypothetical protein